MANQTTGELSKAYASPESNVWYEETDYFIVTGTKCGIWMV